MRRRSQLTPPEKRRLEIARALATEPKLLLLDEALAGLTPAEAAEGVELVRHIRESGVTIVMVEHVMEVVMPLVDRAMVLDLGKVLAKACRPSWCATNVIRPISGSVTVLLEVTTTYQGLVALDGLARCAPGEIVVVAGANGAGKSTLLKSIAGMERPRSGKVTFAGERIDGLRRISYTERGIAFVPENRRLFPRLSVAIICGSGVICSGARPIARRRSNASSRSFRACGTARAARRNAFGRRAADARHRSRADDAPGS